MSIEDRIAEEIRRAINDAVPRAVEQALREMLPRHEHPRPACDGRMTPGEVAARLRRDVSTVRRWARQGKLHALHVNGRLLFRAEDVDVFEAAGGTCAAEETEPNVVAMRILKGG